MKIVAKNKKAFHDYDVLDKIEAGLVLTGDEVKSLREGKLNLTGSFASFHNNQLFMVNAHITPYKAAYQKREDDARRSRKLLLHKKELSKLQGKIAEKGITLVPLKVYFTAKNIAKVELGLCKSKKDTGKKQALKERDIKRETQRELKGVSRY